MYKRQANIDPETGLPQTGALPLIVTSFAVTLLSTAIALPIAIGSAIFAVEIRPVSYTHLARLVLGCEPESLEVGCSGNIIKNVKSVTVPNSGGMRGVEAAAVLGALGGDASAALEALEGVGEADIARTRDLLAQEGYCEVTLIEGVPNLYIEIKAHALGHVAEVAISEHLSLIHISPDAGHVWFQGSDLTADHVDVNALREDIGMVFQGFNPVSYTHL